MANLKVDLLPDFKSLEQKIKNRKLKAGVAVDEKKGVAKGGGGIRGVGFIAGILAIVALLASLKPIQALMAALVRIFSLFLVPVFIILMPILNFLEEVLVSLIKTFRAGGIGAVFKSIGETVINALKDIGTFIIEKVLQLPALFIAEIGKAIGDLFSFGGGNGASSIVSKTSGEVAERITGSKTAGTIVEKGLEIAEFTNPILKSVGTLVDIVFGLFNKTRENPSTQVG